MERRINRSASAIQFDSDWAIVKVEVGKGRRLSRFRPHGVAPALAEFGSTVVPCLLHVQQS